MTLQTYRTDFKEFEILKEKKKNVKNVTLMAEMIPI